MLSRRRRGTVEVEKVRLGRATTSVLVLALNAADRLRGLYGE